MKLPQLRPRARLEVVRKWIWGYLMEVAAKDIGTYAASTTFFLFLSLIPIMMLVSFVIPYFGLDEAAMVRWATQITPDFIDGLITQIIHEANKKAAGLVPISLSVIIWSVAKSIIALMKGLKLVYEVEKPQQILVVRLKAVLYVILMLIFLMITFGFILFGRYLRQWMRANLSDIPFVVQVMYYWRHIFAFIIMILFLLFIYTYVSEVRGGFRKQMPGAIITAALWYIYTMVFSIYASSVQNYSILYGSVAVFVVLLLWLYSCMFILFLGGSLNHYRMKSRELVDAPTSESENDG